MDFDFSYTLEEFASDDRNMTKRLFVTGPFLMFKWSRSKEMLSKTCESLQRIGFYILESPYACKEYMESDNLVDKLYRIKTLLDCDAVYLEKFWWLCKTARFERKVAIECGKDIIYQ